MSLVRVQSRGPGPHGMSTHPHSENGLVDLYMGDRSVCGSFAGNLHRAGRINKNLCDCEFPLGMALIKKRYRLPVTKKVVINAIKN